MRGADNGRLPRIGFLADIQFGEMPDKGNCRFSSSLDRLAEVLDLFRRQGCDHIIQLGDIIEGHDDSPEGQAASRSDLVQVLEVLSDAPCPVHHLLGNHCLSLPREELATLLDLPEATRVVPLWTIDLVLLDSMAWSLRGLPGAHPLSAKAFLAREGGQREEATPWNGGFGQRQLDWLEQALDNERPKIVASHHPIHPGCASKRYHAWDAADAYETLRTSAGPLAFIGGHDHYGGFTLDGDAQFWTIQGLVTAPSRPIVTKVDLEFARLLIPAWRK